MAGSSGAKTALRAFCPAMTKWMDECSFKLLAQIGGDDLRVGAHLRGRSAREDPAVDQDRNAVGEHDMNAVFALADRISVLIYGRILASGTPAQVRADRQVVTAYLGEEME